MVTRDIGVQTDPPPSPPGGPSNQAANPVPPDIPEQPVDLNVKYQIFTYLYCFLKFNLYRMTLLGLIQIMKKTCESCCNSV
jgi:hypothetical protein